MAYYSTVLDGVKFSFEGTARTREEVEKQFRQMWGTWEQGKAYVDSIVGKTYSPRPCPEIPPPPTRAQLTAWLVEPQPHDPI